MGNWLSVWVHRTEERDIWFDAQLETFSPDDRISSLPDDILLLILSLLTINERANTSLLSRRWLNLWVHIPVLDLQHLKGNDQERQAFVKWVNRVLQRHKGQHMKEFKIACNLDNFYKEDIDNWLVFALERKVQSLELNFLVSGSSPTYIWDNYVLPNHVLNFSRRIADSNGGGSQRFDLKCLKSLSLKGVDFPDSAINFFLSSCPFIERLEVVGNRKLANLVFSGRNLSLKYLKIYYCKGLKALRVSNLNLVSLDIPTVRDLTIADLPVLVDLSISRNPSSLSSLSLASSCHSQVIKQLSKFDRMTKLKRLVISVIAFGEESLTMLVPLINSCPRLEEFVLTLLWFDPKRNSTRSIYEIKRSGCSVKSQSLKVFEFNGYYGRVCDAELVLKLMENAVSLEKIIIDPRPVLPPLEINYFTRVEETKALALRQFDYFRRYNYIPPHVHLSIRWSDSMLIPLKPYRNDFIYPG